MNWRGLFTAAFALLISGTVLGQANLLNAKDPGEIGVKTQAQINKQTIYIHYFNIVTFPVMVNVSSSKQIPSR